jgi:hypothetical protein
MQCAVLSPKFQVQREFKVRDISPFPITVHYSQKGEDAMDIDAPEVCELFVAGNVTPSTKLMTFKFAEMVEIVADYSSGADTSSQPGNRIGRFVVEKKQTSKEGKVLSAVVKVRVRLDENHLFVVDNAVLEEEVEVMVEKKVEKKEEAKAEESKPASEGEKKEGDAEMKEGETQPAATPTAAPEVEKVATKTTNRYALKVNSDLPLTLTSSQINANIEEEGKMAAHDQLIIDTAEARNTLESYVYDMRPKVSEGGELRRFFLSSDADDFVEKLNATEDWLYGEEGETATKSVYSSRFDELKKKGDFALNLQFEDKHRAECVQVWGHLFFVFVVSENNIVCERILLCVKIIVLIFFFLSPLFLSPFPLFPSLPPSLSPLSHLTHKQQSVEANIDYYLNWTETSDEKYSHITSDDRLKIRQKVFFFFFFFFLLLLPYLFFLFFLILLFLLLFFSSFLFLQLFLFLSLHFNFFFFFLSQLLFSFHLLPLTHHLTHITHHLTHITHHLTHITHHSVKKQKHG